MKNAIRRFAANINANLEPNWAILAPWAVLVVLTSAYFGFNLFWGSDAEVVVDILLALMFVYGIKPVAKPVTNNHYHYTTVCSEDSEDEEAADLDVDAPEGEGRE